MQQTAVDRVTSQMEETYRQDDSDAENDDAEQVGRDIDDFEARLRGDKAAPRPGPAKAQKVRGAPRPPARIRARTSPSTRLTCARSSRAAIASQAAAARAPLPVLKKALPAALGPFSKPATEEEDEAREAREAVSDLARFDQEPESP